MTDWHEHVMHTFRQMRERDPKATLKEAMRAAKLTYMEMRSNLFEARKGVAAQHRRQARSSSTPERKAHHAKRAERIEINAYAGLLEDFATPFDPF